MPQQSIDDQARLEELRRQGYPLGEQDIASIFPVSPEFSTPDATVLGKASQIQPSISPINGQIPRIPGGEVPPLGSNIGRQRIPLKRALPMPQFPLSADALTKPSMSGSQPDSGPPNPFDGVMAQGLSLGAAMRPDMPPSPPPVLPKPAANPVTPSQPTPPPLGQKPFFSRAERGINNPFLKTLAEVGDVAGSAILPGVTSMIPGTRLNQERGENRELAQQKEQAGIGKTTADTAKETEETKELPDKAALERAQAAEATHKAQEQSKIDPQQGYAAAITDAIQRGVDPATDPHVQAWAKGINDVKVQQQKPDAPEQQFVDEYQKTHPGASIADAQRAFVINHQAPQQPQRPQQQLAVGPDGTVMELKPGMKIPQGSKTMTGDLAGPKATADEERRADLAKNMNENLDQFEEILKRRPDLFGKVAGRLTTGKQMLGTDDPDVATLKGLKEWFGMASVGAHAMRNAQHVITAADAVFNGYKNSPEATEAAIKAARASVKTFQNDVDSKTGSNQQGGEMIRARDPQGKLHEAPKGTALPKGWNPE